MSSGCRDTAAAPKFARLFQWAVAACGDAQRRALVIAAAFAVAAVAISQPAAALSIEITGGGADRLERQRAWARGNLPLAGTPDVTKLSERLSAAGLKEGAAIFVRIFKAESELELWMQRGREFVLFATYPICQWSGVLGPKIYEGDNQSPEGFYTVGRRDLKWQTRHHRAFNTGFPNAFDKLHRRTGSNILVHGGCSTEGCFAMTNPVIDEIFRLANAAIATGQKEFQLHIFPFRMTEANLLGQVGSQWLDFWINLKTGYDLFAETRLPPNIGVCHSRYVYDRLPEFGPVPMERDCDGGSVSGAGGQSTGALETSVGSVTATASASTAGLLPSESLAKDGAPTKDGAAARDGAKDGRRLGRRASSQPHEPTRPHRPSHAHPGAVSPPRLPGLPAQPPLPAISARDFGT